MVAFVMTAWQLAFAYWAVFTSLSDSCCVVAYVSGLNDRRVVLQVCTNLGQSLLVWCVCFGPLTDSWVGMR